MTSSSQRSGIKRFAFPILCLGIAFVAGGLAFKYKPFPYPQIVDFAKKTRQKLAARKLDPSAEIARQYTRSDIAPEATSKTIDTALFPFISSSLNASAGQPFPVYSGSLVIIDDKPVIMDWMGGIYLADKGRIVPKEFPPLPNGRDAFIRSGFAPLNSGNLKVHDAEYIAATHTLAVAHELFDAERELPQMAVSLIAIDPATLAPAGAWRTIYKSDFIPTERYVAQAGGGRLAVRSPEKLLLTMGDYNLDGVFEPPPTVSQNPASSFGKILEIDVKTGAHRTVSSGHRNPQGLVVTQAGDIFSTEHGPAGGDEMNQIVEGADYGWPTATLGTDYGTYSWPNARDLSRHRGYTMPTFAWVPSIGVSNLIEVHGLGERWDGDLLVSSLKAQSLFRLRMNAGHVVYSEPIFIGRRIRDIAQLSKGTIVLWTDEAELITLDVDGPVLASDRRGGDNAAMTKLVSCMVCHHLDATGPLHLAPSLANVFGRPIAQDNFARYTPALKAKQGTWTAENLTAFITDPVAFAPGTAMPKLGLDPQQIAEIVDILVKGKANPKPSH